MKNQSKAFSNTELSAFCEQMAMILRSGISAMEGISTMMEDTESAEEKKILSGIYDSMIQTGSFSQAIDESGLFPAYMVSMVAIGEETGKLDNVMESLSIHYSREDSIARSIRSTVMYPLIMTAMMVVIIVVLLVKVMPVFNQVFRQLGTEMSGLSKALMDLGSVLGTYSTVFVIILAAIAVLTILAIRTDVGRKAAISIGSKFKSVRMIRENTASCRFAGGMALTLSSGLSPDRCLELVADVNNDPDFGRKLEAVTAKINEGEDLSAALHDEGVFTGVYARMANIGQKTGSMDQAMEKIAEQYQDDIDSRMNNLLSVLEPTIVVILSVIVGIILLSVMIPLLGIMSGL